MPSWTWPGAPWRSSALRLTTPRSIAISSSSPQPPTTRELEPAAEDPLTLQELGDEFGISRERVRQLEARLTQRLREYLKGELGDAVGA